MHISLCGTGSETLLSDLQTSGVKFEIIGSPPFGVQNSASKKIKIVKDISGLIPWKTIALVLITWMKLRASREVQITTPDFKVIFAKGYSVEEIAELLPSCLFVTAMETKKPDKQ